MSRRTAGKKQVILSFLLLTLLSASVMGHNTDSVHENVVEDDGYFFSLTTIPAEVKQGEPMALVVHVEDAEGNGIDEAAEMEVLREFFTPENPEPGVYQVPYEFGRFGANIVYFRMGDRFAEFDIDVGAPEAGANPYAMLAIAAMIAVVAIFTFLIVKKKVTLVNGAIYAGILIIICGLGYSITAYQASPAVQGCVLQIGDEFVLHCHQEVYVHICGEEKAFDWEQGDLNRAHTHKGNHRIHWHPPDPVADPEALQILRTMFDDLGYELTETTIEDPETGTIYTVGEDSCGTGPATITVYETLEDASERTIIENYFDYPLKDEAKYDIEYQ